MINLRIFRRNAARTILLWTPSSAELIKVSDDDYDIKYEKIDLSTFKTSIPKDTAGIKIDHNLNSINPFEDKMLKFVFKYNEKEITIPKVLFSIKQEKAKQVTYVYGFDYENNKWVPLPIDIVAYRSRKS